ncbi:MAG TPA: hypothetical protein VML55_26900 [Planctomycetaceae bacterium]|nr:hypothetical protein [Planctomycetaceae bacterium]
MIAPLVLEGTWDEICARADELRGRWLRVEAFTADQRGGSATPAPELPKAESRKGYLATPVILSDEAAATFAFYRPKGASKRVPFRKGGKRLPTVALEQRDEEAGRV